MKIGIYGAGSIGCYLGGHLQNSGLDVVFIGRDKLQKEILENGLRLTGITHEEIYLNKVNYSTNIKDLSDRDLILFCMKSGDTIQSAQNIKDFSKDKVIISFQNGVKNGEKIRSIIQNEKILMGMVPYNVVSMGSGKFHSGTSGYLMIEEKKNISENILQIFKKTKLELKSCKEMENILWGKLIFNLNNSINALAGIPLKEELENPKFRKILSHTMNEALEIMKKSGIKPKSLGKMIPWLAPNILNLPNFLFFRIASSMIKIDPAARSSMWEDLKNLRQTEYEFINGEILDLAKKKLLKAPIQEKIKLLINQAEQEKKGSPNYSPEFLLKELNIL